MDHSKVPALAEGLTADKSKIGDEPKFAQKSPSLIDIFNFVGKNVRVMQQLGCAGTRTCCDCRSHARPSAVSYCHSEYSGCSQN